MAGKVGLFMMAIVCLGLGGCDTARQTGRVIGDAASAAAGATVRAVGKATDYATGTSSVALKGNSVVSGSVILYGNWCGPGHPAGGMETNPPAIDGLDRLCRDHFVCTVEGNVAQRDCDATLVQRVEGLIGGLSGEAYKGAVRVRDFYTRS